MDAISNDLPGVVQLPETINWSSSDKVIQMPSR